MQPFRCTHSPRGSRADPPPHPTPVFRGIRRSTRPDRKERKQNKKKKKKKRKEKERRKCPIKISRQVVPACVLRYSTALPPRCSLLGRAARVLLCSPAVRATFFCLLFAPVHGFPTCTLSTFKHCGHGQRSGFLRLSGNLRTFLLALDVVVDNDTPSPPLPSSYPLFFFWKKVHVRYSR